MCVPLQGFSLDDGGVTHPDEFDFAAASMGIAVVAVVVAVVALETLVVDPDRGGLVSVGTVMKIRRWKDHVVFVVVEKHTVVVLRMVVPHEDATQHGEVDDKDRQYDVVNRILRVVLTIPKQVHVPPRQRTKLRDGRQVGVGR